MEFPKFSLDELEVIDEVPGRRGATQIFNAPITSKENILRLYEGKTPLWIPSPGEWISVRVEVDPDNIARSPKEGIDSWGVPWQWVEVVGGPMVRPGNPVCPDINEWEKYLTVPNPDEWDWKGFAEETLPKFKPHLIRHVGFGSCLFERLIAVLDCAEALMALVDEDQKEGVHRFFRVITDYRKRYYELCKQWLDVDILNFNDDWGTQRAPFFSKATAEEMLVPYATEAVQKAHDLGCYVELHCCGMVEPFVPFFIQEGMDSWMGQPINDKPKLKKMYPNFPMAHEKALKPGEDDENVIRTAVTEFMNECGYDNRAYNFTRVNQAFNKELFIQSRKNFDRMVEEGTAIL